MRFRPRAAKVMLTIHDLKRYQNNTCTKYIYVQSACWNSLNVYLSSLSEHRQSNTDKSSAIENNPQRSECISPKSI